MEFTQKQHAMFESDEKEGDEQLLPAKKHLFLLNNLYNVSVHLSSRLASGPDEEQLASAGANNVLYLNFVIIQRKVIIYLIATTCPNCCTD